MSVNGIERAEAPVEAPVVVDQEAAFWRARYLELLQNHAQIVALMAQRDAQLEQSQKLGAWGEQLKKRAADRAAALVKEGQREQSSKADAVAGEPTRG